MGIINKIRYRLFLREWKKRNKHSATVPHRIVPFNQISIGKYTYGSFDAYFFNDNDKLTVGNFVSIGPEVIFNVSADHHTETLSTYPFKAHVVNEEKEGVSKGNIIIDDDVWIGSRAIILSGVHIGQGAVVGAGAVVTKDVPPYAIVGGVPAKIIRYRFSQPVINYMQTLDYSKLTKDIVKSHVDHLYEPINNQTEEQVAELFAWFPKKMMNNDE